MQRVLKRKPARAPFCAIAECSKPNWYYFGVNGLLARIFQQHGEIYSTEQISEMAMFKQAAFYCKANLLSG